ncbi:hypothetical protein BRX37_03850 [Sphingomonas sp. S-NIH.Pt3_0716]|nr:hypothetical protein BRX37_03850 [Sphingomonas sp. S-NIH.Pt3_0716]
MTDATRSRHAIDMAATMERYAAWEAAAAQLVPDNKQRLFAHLASATSRVLSSSSTVKATAARSRIFRFISATSRASLPAGKVNSLDLPYGEAEPVLR